MSDSSTVLILGAHGRLGSACVQAFADAGWHIIAQ
jgi:NAD(P)-dependent dehydrogenase (short-subunit alcohol dehydrogenase family)